MTLKLPHLQVDDEEELEDAVTGLYTFICSFLVFPWFFGSDSRDDFHHTRQMLQSFLGMDCNPNPKYQMHPKTTRLVSLCRTIQYVAEGCRRFCLIHRLYISLLYVLRKQDKLTQNCKHYHKTHTHKNMKHVSNSKPMQMVFDQLFKAFRWSTKRPCCMKP